MQLKTPRNSPRTTRNEFVSFWLSRSLNVWLLDQCDHVDHAGIQICIEVETKYTKDL